MTNYENNRVNRGPNNVGRISKRIWASKNIDKTSNPRRHALATKSCDTELFADDTRANRWVCRAKKRAWLRIIGRSGRVNKFPGGAARKYQQRCQFAQGNDLFAPICNCCELHLLSIVPRWFFRCFGSPAHLAIVRNMDYAVMLSPCSAVFDRYCMHWIKMIEVLYHAATGSEVISVFLLVYLWQVWLRLTVPRRSYGEESRFVQASIVDLFAGCVALNFVTLFFWEMNQGF